VGNIQYVKQHTYSEDAEGQIFGRNIKRDIEELIDEKNKTSSDNLRDDLDENEEEKDNPENLGTNNEAGKYYPAVSRIDTQTKSQQSQHKVTAEELE